MRKNGEIKRFLDTNRPYRDDGLRNEARRQARLFDRTRKIAKLNIYNTRGYITKQRETLWEWGYQLSSGGANERERHTVWVLTIRTVSLLLTYLLTSESLLVDRSSWPIVTCIVFTPTTLISWHKHTVFPDPPANQPITTTAYMRCGTNTFIMLRCHWILLRSVGGDSVIISQRPHPHQPKYIQGFGNYTVVN